MSLCVVHQKFIINIIWGHHLHSIDNKLFEIKNMSRYYSNIAAQHYLWSNIITGYSWWPFHIQLSKYAQIKSMSKTTFSILKVHFWVFQLPLLKNQSFPLFRWDSWVKQKNTLVCWLTLHIYSSTREKKKKGLTGVKLKLYLSVSSSEFLLFWRP